MYGQLGNGARQCMTVLLQPGMFLEALADKLETFNR